MLQSLRLVNFQAHIDSFIELDEGITSLTGESHEGKTAIMRGLNWAVNNEPSGTGFISYWAKHKTKKGLIVIDASCKVQCIREDGSVLIRERSADFNGYKIDGKVLARAGVGVPTEVQKWFNMGEVNIQNQHDSLFLLHSGGKGGQEVARFLNSVVKLDEIPRALSAVESKKRSTKKLRETESEKITSYEKSLISLGWVTEAEPIFKRLEKVEKDIMDLESKEIDIIEEIDQYDGLEGILDLFKWTKEVSPLLERCLLLWSKEQSLGASLNSQTVSLSNLKTAEQTLKENKWLPEAQNLFSEIITVEYDRNQLVNSLFNLDQTLNNHDTSIIFLESNQPWLENITDKWSQLEMLDHTLEELELKELNIRGEINIYRTYRETLEKWNIKLQENKKRLPKTCVLCGAPTKEGKYESSR